MTFLNLYSEALLRQAVIDAHTKELEALPSEAELREMYTLSKRHMRRMQELLRHEGRKERFRRVFVTARKGAAVAAVFIAILSALLLTNPEVRAAVKNAFNVFVEWTEKFTSYTFRGTEASAEPVEWEPAYVPEGFEVSYYDFLYGSTEIQYTNQEGIVILFISSPPDGVSLHAIDNEHQKYERTEINGVEYEIFAADSLEYMSYVSWVDNGYFFSISGQIEVEMLMEMAYSVAPQK